jgi:uncharacterized protein YndB with AHSA1/START domain
MLDTRALQATGTLEVTAPNDREIRMTRVFNAPRRLVYDAHTKPELVKRWLGVVGHWSMAVCEIDLTVGGAYRYVWHHIDGDIMGISGAYREIVPLERLVTTELFDGDPWHTGEAIGTATFVEQDGKTTLTVTVLYPTPEVRDTVLKSPMSTGVARSYDNLDRLLAASA